MLKWLRRAFQRELGVDRDHGPVVVQGVQLRCSVCSHDSFWAKQIQLHTPFMTFLNLEAWNRVADCAICQKCGHIHWFIDPAALSRQVGGADDESLETRDRAA